MSMVLWFFCQPPPSFPQLVVPSSGFWTVWNGDFWSDDDDDNDDNNNDNDNNNDKNNKNYDKDFDNNNNHKMGSS